MKSLTIPALKKGASRCPRFGTCNAPICPLDEWSRAQHMPGESVCGLLSELVKDGGEVRLRLCVPVDLVDSLVDVLPQVVTSYAAIRKALKRASVAGSKLEAIARLRRQLAVSAAGEFVSEAMHVPGDADIPAAYLPTEPPEATP